MFVRPWWNADGCWLSIWASVGQVVGVLSLTFDLSCSFLLLLAAACVRVTGSTQTGMLDVLIDFVLRMAPAGGFWLAKDSFLFF